MFEFTDNHLSHVKVINVQNGHVTCLPPVIVTLMKIENYTVNEVEVRFGVSLITKSPCIFPVIPSQVLKLQVLPA